MKTKHFLSFCIFILVISGLFSGCEFLSKYISFDSDEDLSSVQGSESLNQTFDHALDPGVWTTSGGYVCDREPVFASWPQYGDALVDTHGKVFCLNYGASLKIRKVTVSEESAVSFDYKNSYGTLKVYLDGSRVPAFEAAGYNQMWLNGSVVFGGGSHSVTFETSGCVYLDNITLASNITASVDIYPKSLQETWVEGMPIQFSAKALRSDGSVISGKNAAWSSTGGSIDGNGLFTPGSSAVMASVTASIDGKQAVNSTVKVHGPDYIADPVTINGHTFTGRMTDGSSSKGGIYNLNGIYLSDLSPQYTCFTTDGFFVLQGRYDEKDVYVSVQKEGREDLTTYYLIPKGEFNQRIWLRFGDGEYTVDLWSVTTEHMEDYDGYEGDFVGWKPDHAIARLYVTNNTGLPYTEEECAYLMPSYLCQSDDYIVSNVFNALMAELPEDATLGQRLQALYDWELHLCHYDLVSTKNADGAASHDKRKVQDAVHVVLYEMGVCEGYANLYTALVRHLGVKAGYQTSHDMSHAWTELLYKGEWKLVDITWDDPIYNDSSIYNVEKNPTMESYNYFLIDRSGIEKDHFGNETDFSRSVDSVPHS